MDHIVVGLTDHALRRFNERIPNNRHMYNLSKRDILELLNTYPTCEIFVPKKTKKDEAGFHLVLQGLCTMMYVEPRKNINPESEYGYSAITVFKIYPKKLMKSKERKLMDVKFTYDPLENETDVLQERYEEALEDF